MQPLWRCPRVAEIDPELHEALCDLARGLLRDSVEVVTGTDLEFTTEFNAGQVLGMERAGARLLGLLLAYGLVELENPLTLDFRSDFGF